jgi:mannose-6-phosphate isomerase-like protein (cupin superfamily)
MLIFKIKPSFLIKICITCFIVCVNASSYAQSDSIISGVYPITNNKLQGKTSGLAILNIHASTLAPGKTNHPSRALTDREELVIVKQGPLTVMINDSSKTLNSNSIVLIVAGDTQSFTNNSDKPVSYYVIGFTAISPVDIIRGKNNGGSLLKDWNELTVKQTAKGEARQVFDKPTSMFERFEVHATTLNAGQESHAAHMHPQEEIMFLMKGNVTMHIANENIETKEGSVIFVRPNIMHNLTNTGTEPCWYYAIKWYASSNK